MRTTEEANNPSMESELKEHGLASSQIVTLPKALNRDDSAFKQKEKYQWPSHEHYLPLILGQFRFGMCQKLPASSDPEAPAIDRFSQLAKIRLREDNQKFME